MIITGVVVTVLGLLGLLYCIVRAIKAKRAGIEGEELTNHLKGLVAINLISLLLSAIGLGLVIVGIIL
tara:strand:+ start:36613 stop:36816 length:204 start_codon:yes stop_codon:yes gene_type:complete